MVFIKKSLQIIPFNPSHFAFAWHNMPCIIRTTEHFMLCDTIMSFLLSIGSNTPSQTLLPRHCHPLIVLKDTLIHAKTKKLVKKKFSFMCSDINEGSFALGINFFIHSNQWNSCHSLQYCKDSTCAIDSFLIWYIFWFFFLSEWNQRDRFTVINEFSPLAEKKPQQNADPPA